LAASSALNLAVAAGAERLAGQIRSRLNLYRQGLPFRNSVPFVLPDR
jgi:hypothetical protein